MVHISLVGVLEDLLTCVQNFLPSFSQSGLLT